MIKTLLVCLAALALSSTANAATVWQDEFNTNTLSSDWIIRTGCPHEIMAIDWYCYSDSPSNVYVDGSALHLALTTGTLGRTYDAASISTFLHGRGWPPSIVVKSFSPPVTITSRIKFAAVAGFWQTLWTMGTDRVKPTELDIAEMRGAFPTQLTCHVHDNSKDWTTGRNSNFSIELPFDFSKRYREYYMKYPTPNKVVFGVWYKDRLLICGKVTNMTNTLDQGIIFDAKTGIPSRWAGIGGPPQVPAEMLVDWIRVTSP